MNRLEQRLPIAQPEKVRCLNASCNDRGYYPSCYLHTYILQDCWRNFFDSLDDEQKDLVLHPQQFYLG